MATTEPYIVVVYDKDRIGIYVGLIPASKFDARIREVFEAINGKYYGTNKEFTKEHLALVDDLFDSDTPSAEYPYTGGNPDYHQRFHPYTSSTWKPSMQTNFQVERVYTFGSYDESM